MAIAAHYLVLLLGLTLRCGGAIYTTGNSSKLQGVPNRSAPERLLRLETIIRAEINGDWQRGMALLRLNRRARSLELKLAICEALWQELQETKLIYNPVNVIDFYDELLQLSDVPPTLLSQVHHELVWRSAHLLSAPFHASSRGGYYPRVSLVLQRLTWSGLDYLRDIFEALFDMVLALESTLRVVQQLGNFSDDATQSTLAHLHLLNRTELQLDADAYRALQDNLRELMLQPGFDQDVEQSLRQQIYAQLPSNERILYTAQKVCLRNQTDDSVYLYECPYTILICTNVRDPSKAAFHLQRGNVDAVGAVSNSSQFAFYSSYWGNRYLHLVESNRTNASGIIKNVYSSSAIYWWHVVLLDEDTVALYDGGTLKSVLCGGNAKYWDDQERHVYTRNATDFDAYRRECVWSIEDCSDVV